MCIPYSDKTASMHGYFMHIHVHVHVQKTIEKAFEVFIFHTSAYTVHVKLYLCLLLTFKVHVQQTRPLVCTVVTVLKVWRD